MIDKSRLEELLVVWEDMRDKGQHVSPDELCRDCPELLDELRQRICKVEWVDRLLDPAVSSDGQAVAEQQELPRTLGRYRLDTLIGEGGFGQVWKAYDPELDRLIAVKVLRRERHRSVFQIARFVDEAKKVARLRHPNIVSVYDVGRQGGYYYFVEDLIEGANLGERMKQGKLPIAETVEIVAKTADALHHAHQRGIVHRDVKPKNILLDERNEPFVTDFGIAITEDALLADRRDVAGTPAYMSPEQATADGPPIDLRTDIFSLGVVLYELLVGRRSMEAEVLRNWPDRSRYQPPPSPHSVDPSIPPRLSHVCMKALAAAPADRWPTAEAFAVHLRASISDRRHSARLAATFLLFSALAVLALLAASGFLRPFGNDSPLVRSAPAPNPASGSAKDNMPADVTSPGGGCVDYPPVRQRLLVSSMAYLTEFDRGLSPMASTGIVVGSGQLVSVKAWGTWSVGPERGKTTGPEWLFAAVGQPRQTTEHYRVGDFVVFEAPETGLLFLGTGDSTADDNLGVMSVEVTVGSPDDAAGSTRPAQLGHVFEPRPPLSESRLLGRDMPGTWDERDEGPAGAILVGMNVSEGILRGFREHTMLESVQPVYQTPGGKLVEGSIVGERVGKVIQVRAKEGYAIGALQVNHVISGLRARFMRILPQALDTQDAYWGDWIGGEPYDLAPVVSGLGRPLAGLVFLSHKHLGIANRHVKAIGLVIQEDGRTADTPLVGRIYELPGFRDEPAPGATLVGLRLTSGKSEGQPSVSLTSVQPLYVRDGAVVAGRVYGDPQGEVTEFRAREGFAVGAIKVAAAERVEGLQLVYMRVGQQRLDPADAYFACWFGTSQLDQPSVLGGDGRPIVGLTGMADRSLHAIGVTQLGVPNVAVSSPRKHPSSPKPVPVSDLLLHLTFDEGTVSHRDDRLLVNDVSGAMNHATGERIEVVPSGVRGSALAIQEGYLRIPHALLNRRREYTLAFWIQAPDQDAARALRYREFLIAGDVVYDFSGGTFVNAWNKNNVECNWKGGAAGTEPLPVGRWVFVACVFRAESGQYGKAKLFVDDKSFEVETHPVHTDSPSYAQIQGESGMIDELIVFDRALTEAEVRRLRENKGSLPPVGAGSTKAHPTASD